MGCFVSLLYGTVEQLATGTISLEDTHGVALVGVVFQNPNTYSISLAGPKGDMDLHG